MIVTAFLAGVLLFEGALGGIPSGLFLGLAQVKPTISAPFFLAAALSGRLKVALVAAMYLLIGSTMAWQVTHTNPLEMVKQLFIVGSFLGEAGTIGPTYLLIKAGIDPP